MSVNEKEQKVIFFLRRSEDINVLLHVLIASESGICQLEEYINFNNQLFESQRRKKRRHKAVHRVNREEPKTKRDFHLILSVSVRVKYNRTVISSIISLFVFGIYSILQIFSHHLSFAHSLTTNSFVLSLLFSSYHFSHLNVTLFLSLFTCCLAHSFFNVAVAVVAALSFSPLS